MVEKIKRLVFSIRTRLLIYFMILSILALSCLIVFYHISMNSIYQLTMESVENSLSQINLDINRIFANVSQAASSLADDSDVQKALREPLAGELKEEYRQRLNFNNKLFYIRQNSENIDGIYVVGANGAIFRSYYSLRKEEYREDDWYQKVMEEGRVYWMEPHEGSILGRNLNPLTISVVVPIQDKASTALLGVVVADVLVEDLRAINEGEMVFGGNTFILNEQNQVIYVNSEMVTDTMIQSINRDLSNVSDLEDGGAKELVINGDKYLANFLTLDSSWKIMGLISYDNMYADAKNLRDLIIALTVLFCGLAIGLTVIGSNHIAKPIKNVLKGMKTVEKGDFSVQIENPGNDELGDLIRGFNHMVSKVNSLMEKERDTHQKLIKAEFTALQSQINPHFLYNTLDSINWMARMNRTDKVSDMIDSLTRFLRIGLSRGKNFITLEEEINHVESYISIQKIRYDRILDYEIDIPESVKRYKVIKMILQPLVENALYHGIKEQDEHGNITITASETEEHLILCVEDDGCGMKPERLAEIRGLMKNGAEYDESAYGVINVQRRIQSYFGAEYGLDFHSQENCGTKVFVILPKREDV